jgi:UDP-2,3-diacylglucosamine hydrolase
VSFYLASDVHLRMDHPDRGRRFSNWVSGLGHADSLLIAGDLCDFWMGARSSESELMKCDGLQALADFRNRGGSFYVMAGNHDRWLCPFYKRVLGASIVPDPFDAIMYGIRLHLVHGHLLGARRKWKAAMESQSFFRAFGKLPSPLATRLDQLLETKNSRGLDEDERRHLAVFRRYAESKRGLADLVVIGHVHRAVDEPGLVASDPRMIVLGGWQHGSSYLRLDASGATFHVLPEEGCAPFATIAAGESLAAGEAPAVPLTPVSRLKCPTS